MSEYLNEMVGYDVRGTAEWRRQKAEQFPDDARNLRSAEELDRLAEQIDELRGSQIANRISAAHDSINGLCDKPEDFEVWADLHEAVSAELRAIGFHRTYETANEFLVWYCDLLNDKLQELIEEAVPAPDLNDLVENDPAVKAAKTAYEDARQVRTVRPAKIADLAGLPPMQSARNSMMAPSASRRSISRSRRY